MAKPEISFVLREIKEYLVKNKEDEKDGAMEKHDIAAVTAIERDFAFNMEKLSDATSLKKLEEKYVKAFFEYADYIKKQSEPDISFILTYASLLARVKEAFIQLPMDFQDYLTYHIIPIPLKQYENIEYLLKTGLPQILYSTKLPTETEEAMFRKIWSALDFGDTIPPRKIHSWIQLMQQNQKKTETKTI